MNKNNHHPKYNFLKININLTNTSSTLEKHTISEFYSAFLKRTVHIDIYLPPNYFNFGKRKFATLFFNDGQDLEAVKLEKTLTNLYEKNAIKPIIVVGIHAGDRMHEYGTANKLDYKARGNKAAAYHQFLIGELLPFIRLRYKSSSKPRKNTFAGFSLGGLSAMNIVWTHTNVFKKVGVFSGSFWWRSKAFKAETPDANRIIHETIENSYYKKGLKFWFQTGTKDETDDRNNNGVIDSIDDTLDVIKKLERLGYNVPEDIKYVEVEGGEHNPETWGKILPNFLIWAFSK